MTKITKPELGKKLAKYGAMSLAIAGVADATGQVVYTDVDPDFQAGIGDFFVVDFNGDGTNDITISQFNNGNYEIVQAQPSGGNGVLANSNGGYFYAINFAYGDTISAGAGITNSFGDMCAGVGYAGSSFCGDDPEGYVGVEFEAGGNTHYGWILIEGVSSEGFILKGYAFEATPNTPITAGDEGTLGLGDASFNDFNYALDNGNNLTLAANTAMERLTLVNVLGQQVMDRALSSNNEAVNLSGLNSGLYIARVSIEGAEKTFKIVVR